MADPTAHLTFLRSLLDRIPTETSSDAHVLLLADLAHAKLLYGDVEGTKVDMDAAWKILDGLPSVENRVRAGYYKVAADYYKVCNESPSFLLPADRNFRRKRNTHHTIVIHCSTLHASTSPPWTQRNAY